MIDEDVKLEIIEKVDGISEWCSQMSFVQKPGEGIRSVVDLVQLNKFVDRPTSRLPKKLLPESLRDQCVLRYSTASTDTGK